MKIELKQIREYTLEFSEEEMNALMEMVGETSVSTRMGRHRMSRPDAEWLSKFYNDMQNQIGRIAGLYNPCGLHHRKLRELK